MEQKLNIQLPESVTELRIGETLDLKHPEKVILRGDFRAVGAFIRQRQSVKTDGLQGINPQVAVIECDLNKMSINFFGDPNHPFGTEVYSKAEYTKELEQFAINGGVTFKREELIKLIKFNRVLFPNKEKHAELLRAYQAFTAKSTKDLSVESDTRGNKAANYRKQVDTNIPTNFVLELPIFKGEQVESFPVEICIEDTDNGTLFWFESHELKELIDIRKEFMFQRELANCEGLCVIWK